ncbi:Nn.00g079420.m01.CDS01 [Neocucurbitaria sp. VM-36]
MHFSPLATALLTSLTFTLTALNPVTATPLDARQEIPHIRATFYNNGGCQEPWAEDTVFTQDVPVGVCQDVTVGPFQSTFFNESSLTRTLRFYTLPCCADEESGQHFDIGPNDPKVPGCIAQGIRSYKVL